MSNAAPVLVPGRECGECTACCTVMTVEAPGFWKPPMETCAHCAVGKGCQIYATRPQPCRDFHCGWRVAFNMDDSWRPDRCGILIDDDVKDIPLHYPNRQGLCFMVFRDPEKAVGPQLAIAIGTAVYHGVPVFLGLAGPPGHYARKLFLNDALAGSLKPGDLSPILALLSWAIEQLKQETFPPAQPANA